MTAEADSRTITRVALRNYKSIAACDVELAPLAILVGANGAGKSNFLDALRFTAQALRFSLDHALRERGGINEVRRRSRGHPIDDAGRSTLRAHLFIAGELLRIGQLTPDPARSTSARSNLFRGEA